MVGISVRFSAMMARKKTEEKIEDDLSHLSRE